MEPEHSSEHVPDEYTEPVVSSDEKEPLVKRPTPHKRDTFGPATVLLIALVCLIVVLFLIYLVWFTPTPAPVPNTELIADEAPVDVTNVPGRDPEVLGLRIDTKLGRFFVLPESGQTLYLSVDECLDTCLEDWTPYLAEATLEDADGPLSTIERPESDDLQYTWNGQRLYIYNADDERSVLGDGYRGTWRLARP